MQNPLVSPNLKQNNTHNPLILRPLSSNYPFTLLLSKVLHLSVKVFDMLSTLPPFLFSRQFTSVSFHPHSQLQLRSSRSLVTSTGQIQQTHFCPQLSQSLKSIRPVGCRDLQTLSTPGCPDVPSWFPVEVTGLCPVSFASSLSLSSD